VLGTFQKDATQFTVEFASIVGPHQTDDQEMAGLFSIPALFGS
jgi:hypothetical protein